MRRAAVAILASGCIAGASAQPASAGVASAVCGVAGIVSGLAGKACNVVAGPVGGVVKKVLGGGGSSAASTAAKAAGLAAVGAWVLEGARFALSSTTKVLSETTTPQLRSTWFSATYWRMTGISALLTLPFLFAAAVHALMRSDLALLARAAFGYLPLAALGVAIAAPLTILLLAASDEMSAIVSSAAGSASRHVLSGAGVIAGVLSVFRGSPFLAFVVGLLATAGALVLWLELILRDAAVYVIVLMLPLAFAAMVWPARRVWAIRAVELLVALILSKFAIVAVLTLGGGALDQLGHGGIAAALAGIALLMLGAFAPWALLRLLPLSELASGAMAPIGQQARGLARTGSERLAPFMWPDDEDGDASQIPARMQSDAEQVDGAGPGAREPAPAAAIYDWQRPDAGPEAADSAPDENAAANGSSTGGGGPAANGTPGTRLPDLPEIWHAGNGEWRPLTLGPEEEFGPIWPHEPPSEDWAAEDDDVLP